MRNAFIVLLMTPGVLAAQQTLPPTQDYWIRVAASNQTASTVVGAGAALALAGNVAFGGMVNEIRHVVLVGIDSGRRQTETAVLIGARRVERNRTLSAAAGLAIGTHTERRVVFDPAVGHSTQVSRQSAPYPGIALELHGSGFMKSWLGVGGGIIANLSRRSSYAAVILSMDLGDLHDPRIPAAPGR